MIRRPVSLIAIAALVAACATSASPSGGISATSTAGLPDPSSGSGPGASPSALSSPASLEDALLDLPASEGALNALSISDGTIVAGGFVGPVFTSTILTFDGTSWSVAEVPDLSGQVTGVARIGDRWIAVGNGLPDNRIGFIWESADGIAWQPQQTIQDAALYDVIAGDGVIVAVGAALDPEMNATAAAWSSADGATWERATVAGSEGAAMGTVATTPGGFLATGDRRLGDARPLWTSTTPTSWDELDNDLSDQLLPTDILAWGDQYVLVGASGKSGDQHPFVALSADGRTWDQTNLSEVDEGYASAAAVANQRLVVAGVDADQLTLWTLRDSTWDADTYDPSGASISALAWDADLGLIGIGSRGGNQAIWGFDN